MKEQNRMRWILNGLIGTAGLLLVALAIRTSSVRSPEDPDDAEQMAKARGETKVIAAAVLSFAEANQRLPSKLEDLVPRFLTTVPLDPYGRAYLLQLNGSDGVFVTYRGKDGKPKGYVERDVDYSIYIRNRRGSFSIDTN